VQEAQEEAQGRGGQEEEVQEEEDALGVQEEEAPPLPGAWAGLDTARDTLRESGGQGNPSEDEGKTMIRKIGLVSGVAAALFLGVASSASAGTLDQQQTSSDTNVGLVTDQSGAQTFTAGITGGLDQADLDLLKVGTPPATVTVEIRSTSAGEPTATVLASGTIATSAISGSGGFVPVTFATPASVTAGTRYALVAYIPGSFGDTVGWRDTAGDPYSGGEVFITTDPLPPGANWNGFADQDFAFKTYVGPPPPPTTTGSPTTGTAVKKKCKKHKKKHKAAEAKKKKCKKKRR
jgi:hypothetical protein